ncbi:hypothetical protein GLYMA_19G249600v4 [Glycine max]|uniref:Uncharacterized protein n=1 Tax=Glycine max TaxID=3847 RepID=A0A0R0ESV3_SOYBN|nr:hypothetical protein GLYMA_19G249600v4 [Glycine max]
MIILQIRHDKTLKQKEAERVTIVLLDASKSHIGHSVKHTTYIKAKRRFYLQVPHRIMSTPYMKSKREASHIMPCLYVSLCILKLVHHLAFVFFWSAVHYFA